MQLSFFSYYGSLLFGLMVGQIIKWLHPLTYGQHFGNLKNFFFNTGGPRSGGQLLFLAVILGVFLGMIMGLSKILREALYPLLVGLNAIPKATVVPIIALMFVGQHDLNTILIAFMISFFPIAVSISIGLSTLEPEYRDILRSLGASKSMIFWKIALPKTLPEFFGALKVAVTLAFIGTNLMEIVSPHGRGLGALFDSGKTNADYPLMFAVLIGLAILGIALYYVVVVLEKIFAGWAERSSD